MAFHRWLYREGRPNLVDRLLNRGWAIIHSLGISPSYLVTLGVAGRQSANMTSFPFVMTIISGERYLVSMLGEETNWVRNVSAAGGKATLRHGLREPVVLEDVDVKKRALILKAYLQHASGARPHMPIGGDADIAEFEKIAAKYPVFRLKTTK